MKPGVYRGIPNGAYHGGPGISKSGLDLIRKSPAHFRAVATSGDDVHRKPTAAQFLGTALHMLVLEPGEFAKEYTLAPSRSDVPDAIDDREVLAAMVAKLNEGRKAKLPTSGSKAELVARIVALGEERKAEFGEQDFYSAEELDTKKGAELKAIIEAENATRTGLLSTSGSRHDLADILRANGQAVTLWSDYISEWMQNNGHRTTLTQEQFEQLRNMRDAVYAHPAAAKLLRADGEAELSAYWMQPVVDPATGEVIGEELCRCRPDYWRKDGLVVDLKTTEDASQEEFARSVAKWSYHVQDSFYQHGVTEALAQGGPRIGSFNPVTGDIEYYDEEAPFGKARAFVFIAVEKTACVVDGEAKGVAVYTLDEDSRVLGWAQWRTDLHRYKSCEESGKWPGYSHAIRQIKLPAWQFQKAAAQAAASE